MNCPNCSYEFDATRGLECPRCGETLDCSAVSCSDCDACGGVIGTVRRVVSGAGSDDEQ